MRIYSLAGWLAFLAGMEWKGSWQDRDGERNDQWKDKRLPPPIRISIPSLPHPIYSQNWAEGGGSV
jgi:hypothetical protein